MNCTQLYRIISFVAAVPTLSSCFTLVDNPGRFREERNLTIGYPGVLYTTAHSGWGVTVVEPEELSQNIYSGKDGAESFSINPDADSSEIRQIHSDSWGANVLALHFPWESSFFFYGFALEAQRARHAYSEHTESFSLDESSTNVEWIDTTVRAAIPLGISINYDEQVTLTSGIGPKFVISNSRTFIDTGDDEEVDVTARDETLGSYESFQKQANFFIYYQVGYSF